MAEAAPSALGDFFAKKSKKKVQASNLNVAPVTKSEETKKKKGADEEGWAEEQVVSATMVVQAVGNLSIAEVKKDEDESSAPAWGSLKSSKAKVTAVKDERDERRFPTLAKAVVGKSSNINIDDGSNATVNIATSKNAFSALDNDEDDGGKRPDHLKPAMIQKKQGEFETTAIRREVDKFVKDSKKKKRKQDKEDNEDSGEEEEEEEDDEVEDEAPVVSVVEADAYKKEQKKKKKADKVEEKIEVAEDDRADDIKMAPDDEEMSYTIEVDKSNGEDFLGLTFKVTVGGLEILSIGDGIISKLNEDAEDKVAVYDRIVSVNDDGETAEMVEELKKSQGMELVLVRPSALKGKYKGRRRLAPVKLSPSELKDVEKENKPPPAKAGSKKNKFANFEEDKKSKLVFVDE